MLEAITLHTVVVTLFCISRVVMSFRKMPSPVNLSTGKYPILIIRQITFLVFFLSCGDIFGKSVWDPFCKEDILYVPYVRVFQKGRPGLLRRDRGPGFIDISGMKDIYVCTNGLVMLYYTKTMEMGEIFEQGELHWAPHHCELYNPSTNNGMVADHPKKTLLSILLIGHPEDYRKPALQMFVVPTFDKAYGDYINLTSLIMMGTHGECIIEKGIERARLRVRNQAPKYISDIPWDQPKPPIFCQLDSQRKLGQSGLITLSKPGNAGAHSYPSAKKRVDLFKFIGHKMGFRGTPLEKYKGDRDHPRQNSETGPNTHPRYRASDFKDTTFAGALGNFADMADEVYAALIQDRKMEFVGCHTYPDYTWEQMQVMETRKTDHQYLKLAGAKLLIKDTYPPFWAEQVPIPGPNNPGSTPTFISRYALYLGVDVSKNEIETYKVAKKKVDDAAELLINKTNAKADITEIKMAEIDHLKEAMLFSLWPLKKTYADIYKYVGELELQMKDAVWIMHGFTGCKNNINKNGLKDSSDMVNALPILNARYKTIRLEQVARKKLEFRLDPYNRKIVDEYNHLVNVSTVVSEILRKKSILLGPMISNSESILAKLNLYKGMLRKTLLELTEAVTKLEKTGKPLNLVVRDPFERYFTDIMIEISDAVKEDLSPIEDNLNAKACYELPSVNVSCKAIKPSSERAGQLLANRKSKGRPWSVDDQWRGKVLNLLEEIFQSVCPYLDEDFSTYITKILTGYLLAEPLGTGLKMPIIGSRLQTVDHEYQSLVYNTTYSETDMENMTEVGGGKLRPMQPFWEQLMSVLEDCSDEAKPMQFWHNEEGGKPAYVTYRKWFHNNNTEKHYAVEDLMMQEKADLEYVFNWAVEMNWRIFVTALGICMPRYENKIPLISARFYAMYSQDFLHPLKQIWMSNRDNPVFQTILGNYFFQEKAERWTKVCMESSFMESGDRSYRPPRSLYVNAFTEMNYFVSGPLAGTSGILSVVDNSL